MWSVHLKVVFLTYMFDLKVAIEILSITLSYEQYHFIESNGSIIAFNHKTTKQ